VFCTGPYATCAFTMGGGACVACGGLDQRCCQSAAGDYCEPEYVCNGGGYAPTCAACGATDEPCCQADTCDTGLACGATHTCAAP
jgi:hypothetical protein